MATSDTSGPSTELELRVTDPDCPFVRASGDASCRVSLEHLCQRSNGDLLEFFAVDGVAPGEVVETAAAEPGIRDARSVTESPAGGLVQFVVSGPCVTRTLADAGAVTRAVSAAEGTGRVLASVPAHVDVRTVVETFRVRHPGSELLASRRVPGSVPVRTDLGVREALAGRLTDRQLDVLRTAHLRGYFEWPRESTAEECAAAMGISQPTFGQHMRAAQRAIAECVFGGSPPRAPPAHGANTDRQ